MTPIRQEVREGFAGPIQAFAQSGIHADFQARHSGDALRCLPGSTHWAAAQAMQSNGTDTWRRHGRLPAPGTRQPRIAWNTLLLTMLYERDQRHDGILLYPNGRDQRAHRSTQNDQERGEPPTFRFQDVRSSAWLITGLSLDSGQGDPFDEDPLSEEEDHDDWGHEQHRSRHQDVPQYAVVDVHVPQKLGQSDGKCDRLRIVPAVQNRIKKVSPPIDELE